MHLLFAIMWCFNFCVLVNIIYNFTWLRKAAKVSRGPGGLPFRTIWWLVATCKGWWNSFVLFCFLFSLSKSKSFWVEASESWHMFNFLSKWPRNELDFFFAFSTPSNYCIWSIKAMENWTWQEEKPKSRLLTFMQTESCRPKTKANFKGQCILDAAQPWTTTVYCLFLGLVVELDHIESMRLWTL